MADIELVIKLDEDIAQGIIDGKNDAPRNIVKNFQATIAYAIKNGVPLPKGHGKLKDTDELKAKYGGWYNLCNDKSIYAVETKEIDWMPTIIDSNKE